MPNKRRILVAAGSVIRLDGQGETGQGQGAAKWHGVLRSMCTNVTNLEDGSGDHSSMLQGKIEQAVTVTATPLALPVRRLYNRVERSTTHQRWCC